MQVLTKGYRGISLLVHLNTDRLLTTLALAVALCLGALVGSLL